jgi:ribosomal protein L11 methyltransferase
VSEWIEIIIPATVASADDVAALLAGEVAEAASGTEIRGGEVVVWAPIERLEEARAAIVAAAQRMAAQGLPVNPAGVVARPAVPESEWRDAWKRYFHVTRLTRQLTIVPSWETHTPGADEIVLHMDPGQAFGTGAHASTRLLMEELQGLRDRGASVERVLDMGTGSGILAIAAARLWPRSQGLAVDIDPLAVAAAAENSARNQVADRVACADTPATTIAGEFDVVLANIQSDVLRDLRDVIVARVAPGGTLLLSGLLATQVDAVAAAYRQSGLVIEAIRRSEHDPDWACARLRRSPETLPGSRHEA